MFKVLITDDDYEDRELLKMEVTKALSDVESDLRFIEAVSVSEAKKLLSSQFFDLMTLDIQFDRMNEGIDALPELFESFPTLNIIVVSGRLNKTEVSEKLFHFTKDNVLKGKRWARHFDVIDKKDDKTEALKSAYSFALKEPEVAGKLRDLFLLAESYMEQEMMDKCLGIYHKIQNLMPGEKESNENLKIFKGALSIDRAVDYLEKGDKVVASLLLGHCIEDGLKAFTKKRIGSVKAGLFYCLKDLEHSGKVDKNALDLFHELMKMRNRSIHHPDSVAKKDFEKIQKKLEILEKSVS